MHYACSVVQVLNSAEKLEEVVTSEALVEPSLLVPDLNKGKQVALLNELEHDEEHLGVLPIRLDYLLPLAVVFDQFDDVWVVHRLNQVYLVLQDFLEGGKVYPLNFVTLDDFDRIEPIVL
jgi:hypothetical protein